MNKARLSFKLILTGLISLSVVKQLQAQFRQLPVDNSSKSQPASSEHLKIKAGPLSLPFWDDFSSGEIDSLKWEKRGVVASKTIGIDPPSFGVA